MKSEVTKWCRSNPSRGSDGAAFLRCVFLARACVFRPHPHLGHFDVPEVFIGGNHHVASFRFVGDVVVTLVAELCKRTCFVRERFEESLVEDCVWCLLK